MSLIAMEEESFVPVGVKVRARVSVRVRVPVRSSRWRGRASSLSDRFQVVSGHSGGFKRKGDWRVPEASFVPAHLHTQGALEGRQRRHEPAGWR